MPNSVDTDRLASSDANWSGSTLFANAENIQVQLDRGSKWNALNGKNLLLSGANSFHVE